MIRVLHVCTEIFPLLKTGGLADVTAALPPALTRHGCDARVLVPGFPAFAEGILQQELVAELAPRFGAGSIRLYRGLLPDGVTTAYLIDAPGLFDRHGNPYVDAANRDYPDNYRRFALLSWVAARMAAGPHNLAGEEPVAGLDPSWRPQVLHGHDWHTGLMPAYLKQAELSAGRRLAGTIFTVHNLAYQGTFPAQVFSELDLPEHCFDVHGVEFHEQLSFLKSGLFYSDLLTTVSPTYAREIQGAEQGCGLDGLLRSRAGDLYGILNGVDPVVWSPEIDSAIAMRYSAAVMAGKQQCKSALQKEMGLRLQNQAPVFGMVSRLAEQKGLSLLLAGLPEILRRGGQLVLLGSGDPALEAELAAAAAAHPESIAVQIGYDEAVSHRIIAGADVILVPSRYEPCGLTQLYGLRYGTLPLVRSVGGLADTVVDSSLENLAEGRATGFVFDAFEPEAFKLALRRAFALYARKSDWEQVRYRAMQQHFEWDVAAQQYAALYAKLIISRSAGPAEATQGPTLGSALGQ